MHSFTTFVGEGDAAVEAQVVQMRSGQRLSEAFEEIYTAESRDRLRSSLLILRMPVTDPYDPIEFAEEREFAGAKLVENANSQEEWEEAFGRVRDRGVHFLSSFAGRIFLSGNINPLWPIDLLAEHRIAPEQALSDIKSAEFDWIVSASKGVLPMAPTLLYQVPSGRKVRSFIRVGNIQFSRDAIDAVFFWLLPHLIGCGGILVDTWSISSIAFNISRSLALYAGCRPPAVEILPGYHDGSQAAAAEATATLRRTFTDVRHLGFASPHVLCLISATHTGSLVHRLHESLDPLGADVPLRFVAIFRLSDSEEAIVALHDMSQNRDFAPLDDAEVEGRSAAVIDPQIYFPLSYMDVPLIIEPKQTKETFAFVSRYARRPILSVHKDHFENGQRRDHQAVHIDTLELTRAPAFRGRYGDILLSLTPEPKLIVSPSHEAGQQMGSLARKIFARRGSDVPWETHDNLYFAEKRMSKRDGRLLARLTALDPADSILIVDDAFRTGARLWQYHRYLRKAKYAGQVHYCVAVARPSDWEPWENAKRYFVQRPSEQADYPKHTVEAVEKILLPGWQEERCPWCQEERLYDEWIQTLLELPPLLAKRHARLRTQRGAGLRDHIFIDTPTCPPLTISPDSFFAPVDADQATIFAAVASALQHLRTEPREHLPLLGPRRFPVATVLKASDYLCEKWTDSILRVAIMRAAIADELVYTAPAGEEHKSRLLHDLLMHEVKGDHDICVEAVLLDAQGKCTLSPDEELLGKIRAYCPGGLGEFLVSRLRRDRPAPPVPLHNPSEPDSALFI